MFTSSGESQHVGTIDQQLGRRLVGVETITQLDATKLRGKTRWCVALRDEDGNRIVFFTNAVPVKPHTVTFVDGIVKRHSHHKGVAQTEILEPRFYRTRETVADYNVAERFRVLCYRIGITGVIVAPRIVRLTAELPEDLDVARRYAHNAGQTLRCPVEVADVDALTIECRIGEAK